MTTPGSMSTVGEAMVFRFEIAGWSWRPVAFAVGILLTAVGGFLLLRAAGLPVFHTETPLGSLSCPPGDLSEAARVAAIRAQMDRVEILRTVKGTLHDYGATCLVLAALVGLSATRRRMRPGGVLRLSAVSASAVFAVGVYALFADHHLMRMHPCADTLVIPIVGLAVLCLVVAGVGTVAGIVLHRCSPPAVLRAAAAILAVGCAGLALVEAAVGGYGDLLLFALAAATLADVARMKRPVAGS